MSDENETHRGRCIVALPADDEPIHAFGEEDKHLTLLYLGKPEENAELDMDTVREIVQNYAAENPPFVAQIAKVGELGDEGAKVAFLNTDDVPQHEALKAFSPQGQRVGDEMGAKAETLLNSAGCFIASVSAPWPPIEWPKIARRGASGNALSTAAIRSRVT